MPYLLNFLTGVFLCNCIPHLAAGLQGLAFPTPFAKPRGVGNSSALVNFLWGFFNLIAGLACYRGQPFSLGLNLASHLCVLGAVGLGVYLSLHFAKVRQGRG